MIDPSLVLRPSSTFQNVMPFQEIAWRRMGLYVRDWILLRVPTRATNSETQSATNLVKEIQIRFGDVSLVTGSGPSRVPCTLSVDAECRPDSFARSVSQALVRKTCLNLKPKITICPEVTIPRISTTSKAHALTIRSARGPS